MNVHQGSFFCKLIYLFIYGDLPEKLNEEFATISFHDIMYYSNKSSCKMSILSNIMAEKKLCSAEELIYEPYLFLG